MRELPKGARMNCELFLNELEELPMEGLRGATAAVLLRELPGEAQEHAARCKECEAALDDFVETRRALEGMPESLPTAGPWFTQRVMHAIVAREVEMEERQNGFWNGVRRLAPRLVAFATLLLMLGGTWAFQVQRASKARGVALKPAEGIFESLPSTPANDDVVAVVQEEQAR